MILRSDKHTCPDCGSNAWDYANVGLPDALQCTDCGHIFPEVLSLFPKVIKTETTWPFPSKIIPFDGKNPKFNPDNHEDAPL